MDIEFVIDVITIKLVCNDRKIYDKSVISHLIKMLLDVE
jgi:hypothetical protein